jgi:hypothetical protein
MVYVSSYETIKEVLVTKVGLPSDLRHRRMIQLQLITRAEFQVKKHGRRSLMSLTFIGDLLRTQV